MQLNFKNITKHYLTITLEDDRSFMVSMPTKGLLNKILAMDTILKTNNEEINANDINPETINDLYTICADIISINKTKTKITSDELGDMWDIEDLILFFNTYMSFLESVTNQKN